MKKILQALVFTTITFCASQANAQYYLTAPTISAEDPTGKDSSEITFCNDGSDHETAHIFDITPWKNLSQYVAYGYYELGKFYFGASAFWESIPMKKIRKNGWIAVVETPENPSDKDQAMNLAARIFCEPHYPRLNFP